MKTFSTTIKRSARHLHLTVLSLACIGLMLVASPKSQAATIEATPGTYVSAVGSASTGDTIVFKSGMYSGALTITTAGLTLKAQAPGTVIFQGVNTRIIVQASDVTIDGFVFDNITNPEGSSHRYVIYLLAPAVSGATYSNIHVTNCAFISCGSDDLEETNAGNIRIDNVTGGGKITDCLIDYCYFYNSRVCGIKFGKGVPENITIEHNYFRHFNWKDSAGTIKPNGNEPIALGSGGSANTPSNSLVQYNYFEDVLTVEGGEPEIISVKSANNTIRYNTIRNNNALGAVTLRDCNNASVYGNFMFGAGMRLYGLNHKIYNNYIDGTNASCLVGISSKESGNSGYAVVENCKIYHNTFINNRLALNFFQKDASGNPKSNIKNNEIRNNILYSNVSGTALTNVESTTANTWTGNLAWVGSGAVYDGTVGGGCSTPVATTVAGGITGSTSRFARANPNFLVDAGSQLYRLQESSAAARDKVTRLTDVMDDFDGYSRTPTTDIGADEYSTASPTRTPYTEASVGSGLTGVGPLWFKKVGFEAEDGLAATTNFTVGTDAAASGDKYIWKSSGSRNDTPTADASYTFFTLQDSTQYYVWFRRIYPSSGSDSFHSRFDGGAWTVPGGSLATSWGWVSVATKTFTRGVHTLDLGYRESGTKLDRILITSDPGYSPSGEGGRATALMDQSVDATPLESAGLYPNPAEQHVNLTLYSESSQNLDYTLVTVQSQSVGSGSKSLQQGVNQVRISLPPLEKGMYILQLRLNNQFVTKKLLVK